MASYDSGFLYDSGNFYTPFAITSITFGEAVTLKAKGKLAGTSSLKHTPSALAKGFGALRGIQGLTFSSTSTLIGKIRIGGQTTLTFIPDAFLSKTGRVRGTTSLHFTPDSLLWGRAIAIGTSYLTTTVANAHIAATGKLQTTDITSFTVTGTMKGSGKLIGATQFLFPVSPKLTGRGALRGRPINFNFTTKARIELRVPIQATRNYYFSEYAKLRISPFSASKATDVGYIYRSSSGPVSDLFSTTSSNEVTSPYKITTEE